ncbi:hypothetical protein [Pseudalkalibacillus berkeleyi]|uniref:Uncharacterized protein n=1 Tax=Pseudalkalibacillus berkeleyi TaxID=1069813 RepID=A0ABS9H5X4_9BACL|nr:hypothetical protein [Pseudalkalibacillus berkeleyi]MCF6139178.1 hypothetical protein [Pseudalkalibacillus berkeleyi]
MGHDIFGVNKTGEDIAYARFSMGNYNSIILYNLLNAEEFHAGVSGNGGSTIISKQQLEKAMNDYKKTFGKKEVSKTDIDLKQIFNFIEQCLSTAHEEGSVKVYFG